ncbi:MAG: PD40 domain-containing protein [Anaerolineae bacterium]|nr:PD40 domain-containing protein [Anaerolineae bacterium]
MAYATTLDGTNVQKILADDRQTNFVSCSPDGKSILTDAGGKEIDQTDVLSLVTTPIFSALPTLYGDPSWSPEGNRIAFNWITNNSSEIYIGNKDGTNITRLTNSPGSDRFPNWSADGTKIVFASERNNSPGIFTINVNGTNETRLTSNTFLDTFPAWSIDGTKIAFTRYTSSSADIYLMNSDGTNLTRVTGPNNGINWGADWSPDGTKIAFTSSRDGNPEVYVMNPDGSGQTRITNNPSTDEAACWLRPINTRPNTGKGLRVQYFHN